MLRSSSLPRTDEAVIALSVCVAGTEAGAIVGKLTRMITYCNTSSSVYHAHAVHDCLGTETMVILCESIS